MLINKQVNCMLATLQNLQNIISFHSKKNNLTVVLCVILIFLRTLVTKCWMLGSLSCIRVPYLQLFVVTCLFVVQFNGASRQTRVNQNRKTYNSLVFLPTILKSGGDAYRVKKLRNYNLKNSLNSLIAYVLIFFSRFSFNFTRINFLDPTPTISSLLPLHIISKIISTIPLAISLTTVALLTTVTHTLTHFAKPARIIIRTINVVGVLIYGLAVLIISDVKLLVKQIPSLVFLYELFFRLEFWLFVFFKYRNSHSYEPNLSYSILNGDLIDTLISLDLVNSMFMVALIVQYGSLYYSSSVRKHILFSSHYLIIFVVSCLIFTLPEYHATYTLLFDSFFTFYILLFIFRALREDSKVHNSFLIQSTYKVI